MPRGQASDNDANYTRVNSATDSGHDSRRYFVGSYIYASERDTNNDVHSSNYRRFIQLKIFKNMSPANEFLSASNCRLWSVLAVRHIKLLNSENDRWLFTSKSFVSIVVDLTDDTKFLVRTVSHKYHK